MKDDFRLVTARNCFLYGEPDEQGGRTIEDEIFSGWAVRILEEGPQGFLKAETHYGYQGYVREECLRRADREELLGRQDHKRFFRIGSPAADVMSVPEVEGVLLETLLKNSFVELLDADPDTLWSRIRTAKGTEGYVHSVFLRERLEDDGYLLQEDPYLPFTERCGERLAGLCVSEEEFRQQILRTAKEYLGTQYRWGGKSSAGLDCSGLVFMSYLENGSNW